MKISVLQLLDQSPSQSQKTIRISEHVNVIVLDNVAVQVTLEGEGKQNRVPRVSQDERLIIPQGQKTTADY